MLPGVTALHRPARIELSGPKGPHFPAHAWCHKRHLCMIILLPCRVSRARVRATGAAVEPAGALA